MDTESHANTQKSQADKFTDAAHKAEADESEAAWEARLKKVITPKTPKNRGK